MILNSPTISGSLTVTGNIIASGSITLSGSVASASYADTASFVALAQSASNAVSAATASFANAFTVASTLTAQTLVVQTITSSVLYSSGSNVFGNNVANTQTFTGSILASGSAFFGGNVLIGSTSPSGTEKFGVTRDDGVTDGLHIIADFNRSGASSAELILGYYASGSAVTGPVVYASNSQPLLFAAGAQERMRLTATGNVGLGVTPSAWYTGYTALQVGFSGCIFSNRTSADTDITMISNNAFLNSAASNWIYQNNGFATRYTQVSGGHEFYTAASGTAGNAITWLERMRITSVGQIGINTSSPVTTNLTGSLTIYKSYNADQASVPSTTAQAYYGSQHGLYLFGRNSGLSIISANSEEGSIKFGNASSAAYATIATSTGTSAVGGDMYFKVGSDTERMRININGTVSVNGTVNGTDAFVVSNPSSPSPYGINISFSGAAPNNTSQYFLNCGDTSNQKATIYSNGSMLNRTGVYGTISSDLRLKENIVGANSKLDDILKLRVVNFNLKDDTYKKKQIGFIAQEFKEVFPSLVYQKDTREYDEDGNVTKGLEDSLGLNVGMEFAILVKAIQELKTQNDALQSRIETLESK